MLTLLRNLLQPKKTVIVEENVTSAMSKTEQDFLEMFEVSQKYEKESKKPKKKK